MYSSTPAKVTRSLSKTLVSKSSLGDAAAAAARGARRARGAAARSAAGARTDRHEGRDSMVGEGAGRRAEAGGGVAAAGRRAAGCTAARRAERLPMPATAAPVASPPDATTAADAPPTVEALVRRTPRTHLTPLAFMVSWQGVLTLAYRWGGSLGEGGRGRRMGVGRAGRGATPTPPTLSPPLLLRGFPPALERLKAAINAAHPGLPAEAAGALWPKTSLAALRDGARLTPAQLDTVTAICDDASAALRYEGDRASVPVDAATVAVFACRSLERLVSATDIEFDASVAVDDAPPTAAAEARVAAIVAEPTDPDYWFAASRDGHRASHYRGDAVGATLVVRHRMHAPGEHVTGGDGHPVGAARLARVVADFRARVDAALPGAYVWFEPESRHVTLRGLVG